MITMLSSSSSSSSNIVSISSTIIGSSSSSSSSIDNLISIDVFIYYYERDVYVSGGPVRGDGQRARAAPPHLREGHTVGW